MKKTLVALSALPMQALGHEGHGSFGSHWHATDVLGFVLVAAAGVALWWSGRK